MLNEALSSCHALGRSSFLFLSQGKDSNESQEGQVSTIINKAFSKVVTRPYFQTHELSMTENNFLFLIRQMKQLLKK